MGGNLIVSIFLSTALFMGGVKLETPLFMVQATVDSAKLIGLPASRVIITQNRSIQEPSFFDKEQSAPTNILSWRRVFFRKYFS